MKKLSKMQQIKNTTDIEWTEISSKYKSASDYLRNALNMSENGRYTSFINKKLKELNLTWAKTTFDGERICPVCNKKFIVAYPSDKKITCSYSCSNTYFRSGKKHGNYTTGIGLYRKLAFDNLPNYCNNCGIKDKDVLVVHHKDRNRNNNKLKNLEILCANCHMKEHSLLS